MHTRRHSHAWQRPVATHTHTHTHKVLPLPTAIHHSHSFRMWTVQREACDLIYEFVLSRKGRLFGIFLDNA